MTPEELKDKWRRLNASDAGDDAARRRSSRPPFYDDRMIGNVTSGRVTSARERLMGRYRMMFAGVARRGWCVPCRLRACYHGGGWQP